jgi:hypothetical protein
LDFDFAVPVLPLSQLISLASVHRTDAWLRQTPGGAGVWGGNEFRPHESSAGTLIVCDDLGGDFPTRAPRGRRVLVVTEPPGIRTYRPEFLAQFGLILSPYPMDGGQSPVVVTQTGLPWFHGLRFDRDGMRIGQSFEDLVALRPGPKDNRLSVVCSTKSNLPRHRERLKFVMALKDRLQDRLVIRGRGFEPVVDKGEAIGPHRYHLVVENNNLGCFWTEKLADAFLGWSFPLFAGARDAVDDFPLGSMVYLDIRDHAACIAQVEKVLDDDLYETRLPALTAAREKLLYEHNFFALISREVEKLAPALTVFESVSHEILRPSSRPGILKTFRRSLRGHLRRAGVT